jgi:hypothetical protein
LRYHTCEAFGEQALMQWRRGEKEVRRIETN